VASIARWALEQARRTATVYAEGNMTSVVEIWRFPDIDSAPIAANGDVDATGASLVYAAGPARLSNGSGPVTYTLGEQVEFFTSAGGSIPLEVAGVPTDPQVNDLLHVLGSDDPVMAGRWFRVVDVEVTGTLAVVRRMQLVGIQRSPTWTDTTTPTRTPPSSTDIPPEWQVA
jgi:hypothetical protein